jgi:uncharacterized protein YndB with AHSA1/START domain
MRQPDFTTTFVVDQTAAEVFSAVTDVRGWWSQQIDGDTDRLHAEFHYDNGEVHQSTMHIMDFVPQQRVVWKCLANTFNFVDDPAEWVGTTLHFVMSAEGERTRLTFTHVGLVPDYECFEVCSSAWGGYVGDSLRSLITTGKGNPNNAVRDAEALSQRH